MGLYLLGLAIALLSAKLLSVTIFRKSKDLFILELPPYRIPQLRTIFNQTMKKARDFLTSAGVYILAGSLIMWFLQYAGPLGLDVEPHESFLAIIGNFIAPLFTPLGLGTWQIAASLVVGFFAKELVASSLLIIAGSEAALGSLLTPSQAVSFLIFTLLYIPCLATVGVMQKETGSLKITLLMMSYGFITAYLVSFIAHVATSQFF